MSKQAKAGFYSGHLGELRADTGIAPHSLGNVVKRKCLPGLVLLSLLALLNFTGCATLENAAQTVNDSVQFELVRPPVVVREEKVRREPPVVHVYPVTEAAGLKVLFMPFRVTQPITDPELAGWGIAKLFWQTWASMEVFEYMEFFPEEGPFRTDSALRIARAKGADLLISGHVTSLLSGGGLALSALALQLEAYDVASGVLVWSMAQAGSIPKPESRDYILFTTRSKISSDPLYTLTTTLAGDMGKIMLEWNRGDSR